MKGHQHEEVVIGHRQVIHRGLVTVDPHLHLDGDIHA